MNTVSCTMTTVLNLKLLFVFYLTLRNVSAKFRNVSPKFRNVSIKILMSD